MNVLLKLSVVTLTVSTLFSLNAKAGSVSGGGGGVIVGKPVGALDIENMIKNARAPLLMFFRGLEGPFPVSFFPELFSSKPSIYDVIQSTAVEVRSTEPCKDLDGLDVDGSILASTADAICISSQRLGAKLDRTQAFSQTVALLAHEFSHKVGFNEKKAEELQEYLLYAFEEYGIDARTSIDYANQIEKNAQTAASALEWFQKFATISDWDQRCLRVRWLEQAYDNLFDVRTDRSLWLNLLPKTFGRIEDYSLKVFGLRVASCGQASPPLKDFLAEDLYAKYLTTFASSSQLSLNDFHKGMFFGTEGRATKNVFIKKIGDGETAKTEADDLAEYLKSLTQEANRITTELDVRVK